MIHHTVQRHRTAHKENIKAHPRVIDTARQKARTYIENVHTPFLRARELLRPMWRAIPEIRLSQSAARQDRVARLSPVIWGMERHTNKSGGIFF